MTTQNQTQDRTPAELQAAADAFLDTLASEGEALMVSKMIQERFNLMGSTFGHRDILGMLQDRIPSLGGDDAAAAMAEELASTIYSLPGVRSQIAAAMTEGGEQEMTDQLDAFIYPLLSDDCAPDLVLSTDAGEIVTVNYLKDMDELSQFAHDAIGKSIAEMCQRAESLGLDCKSAGSIASEGTVTVAHVSLVVGEEQEEFLVKVA